MPWAHISTKLSANTEPVRIFVSQTTSILTNYVGERGLKDKYILENREDIETALFSYISTSHLNTVRIEVFNQSDDLAAVEWGDFQIDTVSPDNFRKRQEAEFDKIQENMMGKLHKLDPLPSDAKYRVLLSIGNENEFGQPPASLKEWAETTPRSPPESANVDKDDRQSGLTWITLL